MERMLILKLMTRILRLSMALIMNSSDMSRLYFIVLISFCAFDFQCSICRSSLFCLLSLSTATFFLRSSESLTASIIRSNSPSKASICRSNLS